MVRELSDVRDARSEVHAQHHVRAALYFGIGSVEAFLNEQMRTKMSGDGSSEEQIFTALRRTRWNDKLKSWPTNLAGRSLPASTIDAVKDLSDLRGEVTHPKAKDHSIYLRLDELLLTPDEMRLRIAEYMVRLLSSMGKPYPFYLHGRVFVGMGGDWNRPIVDTDNQQFMFALANLGFRVPAGPIVEMDAWERACMSSWEGFLQGEAALANAPCQTLNPIFPYAPRLCRRWWDPTHVEICGGRFHDESEPPPNSSK